jgi:uncharacterized protein DUF6982
MNNVKNSGSSVVARFVDGRVLKGTTHDFAAQKPIFHLSIWGDPTARALAIPVGALKALFFVRTFEGDPNHVDDRDIAKAKGQGRKIVVTFTDGEIVAGFTAGYSKDKQGFFVIPVDQEANNARVYVVAEAVKKIEWADAPTPARVSG